MYGGPGGRVAEHLPAAKALVRRWAAGRFRYRTGPLITGIDDPRGPIVTEVETRTTSITPELVAQMAVRYGAGSTTRELGAIFGISHRAVSRYLKAAGVRLRGSGQPDEVRQEAASL
ncbi:helix-turn-helix domain-containing protein [Sediminivirga luteola]|uniref:helix-turn-helix domain-containing protein n=1 Tax=Sediminivirga luteola TaxID=1774748 RepID=UPI003571277F